MSNWIGPKCFNVYINVDSVKRLRVPGMSFGHGDSNPYLVCQYGDFIVIRIPSSNDWVGRGERVRNPAQWKLLKVAWGDWMKSGHVVEELESHEPGRRWRDCGFHLRLRAECLHLGMEFDEPAWDPEED